MTELAFSKIEIQFAGDSAVVGTKVFIDGNEVNGLCGVKVEHHVGDTPKVELWLIPRELTVQPFSLANEFIERVEE